MRFCYLLVRVVSLVVVRSGRGAPVDVLVGAFREGLQPLPSFSSFQMDEGGVLWKAIM